MVALRKGHLRGKMAKEGNPTCPGDFQGAAGKQEVGKGVMKAGVSVG